MQNSPQSTARWLGAAFVLVFTASLASGLMRSSAMGVTALGPGGDVSGILNTIPQNLPLLRFGILLEFANVLGIIALAALLYTALKHHNPALALIALGWWLLEAATLVVSKIGTLALIPLSLDFVAAGSPAGSGFQTLGSFLYYGIDKGGYDLHMLFFSMGALIWYGLFYQSRAIPRWLSIWGLVAMLLVTGGTLVGLYDSGIEVPTLVYAPYIPFELFIGGWLLICGFESQRPSSETTAPALAA